MNLDNIPGDSKNKEGLSLDGLPTDRRAQLNTDSHTMYHLEMAVMLQHMSLDCGGNQSTQRKSLTHGKNFQTQTGARRQIF